MSVAASVGDVLRAGRGVDASAPTNIGSGASVLRVIYSSVVVVFFTPITPICIMLVHETEGFLLDSCCSNYSAPGVSIYTLVLL